ncbi:MAG: Peptidase protein [Patescibacteria group bacterium]|nr:Peptidase protein [Patescibacteria group bacterium]
MILMLVITPKQKKLNIILISLSFLGLFLFSRHILAVEYTLDNIDKVDSWQINQDINDKRAQIDELKKQMAIYEKNVEAKKNEIGELSAQLSILNSNIAKINLEIQAANLEIEATNLKIDHTELKIQAKEKEILGLKENVAEILRSLHQQQQQSSLLEILIINENFSDFMNQIDQLQKMQDMVVLQVNDLKTVKMAMLNDQADLENNRTELDALKNILDNRKDVLDEQKNSKAEIVKLTQGQQAKFEVLLKQAKAEQSQANSDIVYLEKIAREKLNRELQKKQEDTSTPGLAWPVNSRTITAYFHDPEYPFRYVFEHPAIDLASPQGTPIKAVQSGYVAKAKDGGKTGYSYIMIVHAEGLSSVYGHINQISVENEQFVSKGQVIGYSGGMPGTRGAGPLSTGPHLHLEIRLNGVPVDPLNYLP